MATLGAREVYMNVFVYFYHFGSDYTQKDRQTDKDRKRKRKRKRKREREFATVAHACISSSWEDKSERLK